MRIALIADAYPPLRTSAAVQLRDLSQELARQGHVPTVLVPSADITRPWQLEELDGVQVLRLRGPRTKDISYFRRTLGEFVLPFMMLHHFRSSPLAPVKWDGVVWYSPTIFLGPMVSAVKRRSACRSYLILRDIFPEWAVDMRLLNRGFAYRVFKQVERYQYSVADTIGVQTPGNLKYFQSMRHPPAARVEVLQNWLADARPADCSISVAESRIGGRKIFVYAGNMGIAQGMDVLLDLAERMRRRADVGFLFVGRGSDAARLSDDAKRRGLDNVVFNEEIDPSEIPGLYAQCHVGLIALDPRHSTHNIPGKFLSYMQSGLPVLAAINPGNDLKQVIENEDVGRVCCDNSAASLHHLAEALLADLDLVDFSARCRSLAASKFSAASAARQIVAALGC